MEHCFQQIESILYKKSLKVQVFLCFMFCIFLCFCLFQEVGDCSKLQELDVGLWVVVPCVPVAPTFIPSTTNLSVFLPRHLANGLFFLDVILYQSFFVFVTLATMNDVNDSVVIQPHKWSSLDVYFSIIFYYLINYSVFQDCTDMVPS
jgi:hypothetical protein